MGGAFVAVADDARRSTGIRAGSRRRPISASSSIAIRSAPLTRPPRPETDWAASSPGDAAPGSDVLPDKPHGDGRHWAGRVTRKRLVTNQAGAHAGAVDWRGRGDWRDSEVRSWQCVRRHGSQWTELDVVAGAVDRGLNAFDANLGVMATHSAFKAGVTYGTCSSRRSSWTGQRRHPARASYQGPRVVAAQRRTAAGRRQRTFTSTAETGQYPLWAGRRRRRRDPTCPAAGPSSRGRHPLEHAAAASGLLPRIGECRRLSYPALPVIPADGTGHLGSSKMWACTVGWAVWRRVCSLILQKVFSPACIICLPGSFEHSPLAAAPQLLPNPEHAFELTNARVRFSWLNVY